MLLRRRTKHHDSANTWRGCCSKPARNPFSKRWLVSVPENLPSSLAGKRVVITRAAAQSEALARELSAHGAFSVVWPMVSFAEPEDYAPLDRAIAEIQQFNWLIFTSAQAVSAVVRRSAELSQPLIR